MGSSLDLCGFPKHPGPQSNPEKNIMQIPVEGHPTNFVVHTHQNSQGHQKRGKSGVPAGAQWVKNLTAVAQVVVVAQIGPLAWEFPYAMGAAKKKTNKQKPTGKPEKLSQPQGAKETGWLKSWGLLGEGGVLGQREDIRQKLRKPRIEKLH